MAVEQHSLDLFSQETGSEASRNLLFTIKQASEWASNYLGKSVTPSNISYLIQYGRIKKINAFGATKVSQSDLIAYYEASVGAREKRFKSKLGDDINWALSFEDVKESETTKHVHRLHQYKGKYIPQLVEYFLDSHIDQFKKEIYFAPNDIVLDLFSGSGTTLVQANELGMHAVGVDISAFNALIANSKIKKHDRGGLQREVARITTALKSLEKDAHILEFERELTERLSAFNKANFPSPNFKYRLNRGEINEKAYAAEMESLMLDQYAELLNKYGVNLTQDSADSFLDRWYLKPTRDEMNLVLRLIDDVRNEDAKRLLMIIFSRVAHSCRATTHSDLGTLRRPTDKPYYCVKHAKICRPLFSIVKWWEKYAEDTLARIGEFDKVRTETAQVCLTGDSRTIDYLNDVNKCEPALGGLLERQKFAGIFSSPPYVGLIDYHEQHAYAYDLFGIERRDDREIGALFKGSSPAARKEYVDGVSQALANSKKFMRDDYNVFLVANDKFGLYPQIAELAGMKIVNEFKRPVLNRCEKVKTAYSETIFHMKEK